MSSAPPSATPLPSLWLVYVLIVICAGVEFILQLGDARLIPLPRLRETAYEYAGFWPGLLGAWRPNYAAQPYAMFATYAFLHGGLVHTIFNMVTLWSLGRNVIDRVGTRGFALLYTAAVLGGALGFGFLAKTTQPMVGASGGLFGLVGGVLAWNYVDRFSEGRRLWPVLRAICILIGLNVVLWWAMDGLLAWETHLGGFVAGWVAAFLIDPRGQNLDLPEDNSRPNQR